MNKRIKKKLEKRNGYRSYRNYIEKEELLQYAAEKFRQLARNFKKSEMGWDIYE